MKTLKNLELEPLKRFFKKCLLLFCFLTIAFSIIAQEGQTGIDVKRKSAFIYGGPPLIGWERDYRVSDKAYLGFGIGLGLGGYYQAYFKNLNAEKKGNFSITGFVGAFYLPGVYDTANQVGAVWVGIVPAWDRFYASGKFMSFGIGPAVFYAFTPENRGFYPGGNFRLKFGRWR